MIIYNGSQGRKIVGRRQDVGRVLVGKPSRFRNGGTRRSVKILLIGPEVLRGFLVKTRRAVKLLLD